jgi:hypothetical protein
VVVKLGYFGIFRYSPPFDARVFNKRPRTLLEKLSARHA